MRSPVQYCLPARPRERSDALVSPCVGLGYVQGIDVHDDSIPVIDLEPFVTGDEAAKEVVGREVDDALRSVGFMLLVGHGVSADLIERARSASLEFFAMPLEEKMRAATPPERLSRGYNWVGNRSLAYTLGDEAPPDLQEGFAFGPLDVTPEERDESPAAARLFAENEWPEHPADFRRALETYYGRIADLAATMMHVFAVGLGLPETFFDAQIDRHTSALRVVHYPPQSEPPEPGQLRAGAHTDYGTLTILYGDDTPGGLQVRHRNGGWLDVHPPPGSLVCNIGDLMARWTNDRWVSNLHRVVNPPPEHSATARLSMPFFHNANHDAVIECVPTCRPEVGEPTYPPIRFSDHYFGKQSRAETMKLDVEETS
ncbi:MAG: isopenicillin N synthase family dioxygenase [Acidimicrobiales bacterium]